MTRPRVFLDSCVLIEALVAPWSASRGLLILGRAALFTFVLAEIVIEETERALATRLGPSYGGAQQLRRDFRLLLERLKVERVPHATRQEFQQAQAWIRHANDAPVLAAAVKAKPDWFLTGSTARFNAEVAMCTGLEILTPAELLERSGRVLSL